MGSGVGGAPCVEDKSGDRGTFPFEICYTDQKNNFFIPDLASTKRMSSKTNVKSLLKQILW